MLQPIGFWSYSRDDDKRSRGRLSQLRALFSDELQSRVGRTPRVELFQDVQAIAYGDEWENKLQLALQDASFIIPILTPAFLQSEWCCREVTRFLEMAALSGRRPLVFPIHYVPTDHVCPDRLDECHDGTVLHFLRSRHFCDLRLLRHEPADSAEVTRSIEKLADAIFIALRSEQNAIDAKSTSEVPNTPMEAISASPLHQASIGSLPPSVRSPIVDKQSDQIARSTKLVVIPPSEPIQLPRDVTNHEESNYPRMVLVSAGSFLMGIPDGECQHESASANARPQHRVTIKHEFYLGEFPVTHGEYSRYVAESGYTSDRGAWRQSSFPQDDRHPVINVSHADAEAYAAWLSRKTGHVYRLPTEAEWEYAARAGTVTANYWGDDIADMRRHSGVRRSGTTPVGLFLPNGFGLYDMLGGVWEWMADVWHDSYKGAPTDGSAWTTHGNQSRRVLRGGSWLFGNDSARVDRRSDTDSSYRSDDVGFRVAKTYFRIDDLRYGFQA